MITIENVTKAYGGTVVVGGVSLELPKGGVTSLIGPNGAGKSTLLSMMSRLLAPDSGAVFLDDLDVAKAPSREVARLLAVLRQENHLTVRLTVRDLVTFGRFPHSKGRPTHDDVRKVDEALGHLGLHPLADRFLDELSGGQRQRAYVAMVLAQGTDYVLLDEPLNNLDMRHAAEMMRNLRSAADELRRTVVLVVHDINAASVYSDHIVALRDGRVLAQGSPRQIMQADLIEEVFGVPIRIECVDGHLVGHHFIPPSHHLSPEGEPVSPTPPAVHESRADVATGKPARYAKQLASHLGRKVPAEPTETGHRITIAGGVCELEVHEDTSLLVLLASAPDAESLTRVQDVVGRHLVGFGARDGLVVEWSSGHRHDPA